MQAEIKREKNKKLHALILNCFTSIYLGMICNKFSVLLPACMQLLILYIETLDTELGGSIT
jgi:hypothetical protein